LRALALTDSPRSWRLAIVGEGPERKALEQERGRSGLRSASRSSDTIPDPFGWMMRAALVVCSSRYEASATRSSRRSRAERR